MSRPREVRAAQREAPKRHPEMFDQLLDDLDAQGEDEEIADPYFGDTYHTMPGFGAKEKSE